MINFFFTVNHIKFVQIDLTAAVPMKKKNPGNSIHHSSSKKCI